MTQTQKLAQSFRILKCQTWIRRIPRVPSDTSLDLFVPCVEFATQSLFTLQRKPLIPYTVRLHYFVASLFPFSFYSFMYSYLFLVYVAAEATTILMTLVKKGACHKLGVLECSIRVSQTKSKKALFTDDIEIYPEFPAEGHEDVDAEYTKEMATPEPPVTDSDIIAAAKELSLDKDFSSLQEYPFFSSLTARGKLALLRFERAWRDLLPLRFVVAAEGIAAPPFPQHFLASNIPPRQRFFASATESTATTATVAEKTAEVVAKSESTADVADDTVPTTKGARVTRKRKLSEISFSSDVSDVSEDENDAGSSTVPAKGSASSSNSDNPGTPASNGYTKMEGGNMSAMVGQYNLGNIYGESFDEDDYTQPVPGVASPSAASGVCAQKSNLWRFGWEAATAHMRNEILARYSGMRSFCASLPVPLTVLLCPFQTSFHVLFVLYLSFFASGRLVDPRIPRRYVPSHQDRQSIVVCSRDQVQFQRQIHSCFQPHRQPG